MSFGSMISKSRGRKIVTIPSKKNSIGNMNSAKKMIGGVKKIANKTVAAPKIKQYSVKQIGKAAHQPTARM